MQSADFTIEVGSQVWMEPTGNASIGWDGVPIEGEIVSCGRKYYYVARHTQFGLSNVSIKVEKETNICEDKATNQGYVVFPSHEAFDQAQDCKILLKEIKNCFSHSSLGRPPYIRRIESNSPHHF